MNALIFTKQNCSFCTRAKALLYEKNITPIEVDAGDPTVAQQLRDKGHTSVPVIIIEGETIGGYTELVEWFNHGGGQQLLVE